MPGTITVNSAVAREISTPCFCSSATSIRAVSMCEANLTGKEPLISKAPSATATVVPRVVKPWNISWDTRYAHPLEHGNKVVWEVHEKVPLEWGSA